MTSGHPRLARPSMFNTRIFIFLFCANVVFFLSFVYGCLGFVISIISTRQLAGAGICVGSRHLCILLFLQVWWRCLNCYFLLSEGMDAGSQSCGRMHLGIWRILHWRSTLLCNLVFCIGCSHFVQSRILHRQFAFLRILGFCIGS